MRSEKFGRFLKGAIGSIVAHEGKTAPVVEEELGEAMGLSPASIQRYKAGHIPPDRRNLEILAQAAIRRGYLNRQWLAEFLQIARYSNPTPLIEQLCPAFPGAGSTKSPVVSYNNLPAPTYSQFVEREKAYAEVVVGLRQRSAVVLVVSLGGMGKTSLAREIASDCLKGRKSAPLFQAVVWVSDQAQPGSTTLDTVLDEIALTLDFPGLVQHTPALKRREVENLLRRQAVLLVVDNFETVTDPTLPAWLVRLPEPSKALVTSRENSPKFRRSSWPVEMDGLNGEEAQRFLVEKIASLKLGKLVPEIRQLDPLLALTGGNPKALELALGYLKYSRHTLAQVTANLEAARGELFDDLFRHNWETLGAAERAIFTVLPLFSDPALAESLSATASLSRLEGEQALENLVGLGLVDLQKSGLDTLPRYLLHPLSRAFAQARLAEKPDFESEARLRQLEWFTGLAGRVGYAWNDLAKLEILDPEQETLQNLILWGVAHHRYAEMLPLIAGVDYYFYIRGAWRGQPELGRLRIEAAAAVGNLLQETTAVALYVQTLSRQQRLAEAGQFLTRLEEIAQTLTLPDNMVFEVEYTRGLYRMARQEFSGAIATWQDSLELAQRVSARSYAVARGYLAICLYQQGQPESARDLWEAILEETASGGFLRGAISSRIGLARLYLDQTELAGAKTLLGEAAALAVQYQDRERTAEIDSLYARYYLALGDQIAALEFASQARDVFERLGIQRDLADIRLFLASLDNR